MNIVVLLKMVPDVVEELEVAPDGKSLNDEFLRLICNERDEHALEEALLLKERHGGTVSVLALEGPEVEDALFTALAKGADRIVKLEGIALGLSTWSMASALAQALKSGPEFLPADLVLTGCQAIDDLDGLVAPVVARELKLPYLGLVTRVEVKGDRAQVAKEYPGGVHGVFEVSLPAVLGIQAAEKPPRYVPVAKVRAAQKTQKLETLTVAEAETALPGVDVKAMAKREAAGHAEMLEGKPEQVAGKILEVLSTRGVL